MSAILTLLQGLSLMRVLAHPRLIAAALDAAEPGEVAATCIIYDADGKQVYEVLATTWPYLSTEARERVAREVRVVYPPGA